MFDIWIVEVNDGKYLIQNFNEMKSGDKFILSLHPFSLRNVFFPTTFSRLS